MKISIRKIRTYTIIDIHSSKLDNNHNSILKTALHDLIISNSVKILINLSKVESIESNFLVYLIAAQKKCLKKGGEICIYGVQSDLLMILYLIQLDKYIKFYNSEFDALSQKDLLVRRRFKVISS